MEKHFHTIEAMIWGGIGALILFNGIRLLAAQGAHREDWIGTVSRGGGALVKF
jgi:hypothetical protein